MSKQATALCEQAREEQLTSGLGKMPGDACKSWHCQRGMSLRLMTLNAALHELNNHYIGMLGWYFG